MFDFSSASGFLADKRIAAAAAVIVAGGALGGYAIHEHSAAQQLAAKNAQTTAALSATQQQLTQLTAKVNTLVAETEKPSPSAPTDAASGAFRSTARPAAPHQRKPDLYFKKLQAQLDAQGKAIAQTQNELQSTQGDLSNTRTELTGSIAHNHDELVALEKKGERSFTEFDLNKTKQFEHKGPFGIRLKKANVKHQYADLELIVDDRTLSQKHVNLYQPVMFSTPDSPQPVEVVINEIGKDHIHGYVSAPRYQQSELASMSNQNSADQGAADQGTADASSQPSLRKRLTVAQGPPQ
jgi:hypothetical protein